MRTVFEKSPEVVRPTAPGITALELLEWLKRPGAKPVVIDVRGADERAICALPETVHIPMWDIPKCVETLDRQRDTVVLCHHGIRSRQVANYLLQAGFTKVYNLTGGIDAWAVQVDPSMRRY
jgi:rhodanese-related sulfurtransferase